MRTRCRHRRGAQIMVRSTHVDNPVDGVKLRHACDRRRPAPWPASVWRTSTQV